MILSRRCIQSINYIPRRFVENLPRNIRLTLDPSVNDQLKSENTKLSYFKQHKGKFNYRSELPKKLEEIINSVISDIEPDRLKRDVKQLHDYLVERRLPIEQRELETIAQNVIQQLLKVESSVKSTVMSPDEREKLQQGRQSELIKRLKSSIYHWEPLNLDEYHSKIYLATTFASHYAMLVQIFNEIKQRETEFRPVRLFDFGSGAGSVMWAAWHAWGKKAFAEILNVDKSRDMNHLSQLLLRGGQENKPPIVPGVIYRQFMPHGRENIFDLVVADHTLFELESRLERLQVMRSLWYTVKPGGFLILVENGNIHGYSAIMEARDNLLNRIAVSNSKEIDGEESKKDDDESSTDQSHFAAHIFSPCPHDAQCPKRELNIPCRIGTRYRPLQLFDIEKHVPAYSTVQMSYVVVKKGKRDENDDYGKWPRVIEPVLDRKRHQHVRLCCPNGQYVNLAITKNKHGKAIHRLSHHAAPGDLFPVTGDLAEEDQNSKPDRETESTLKRPRRRAFRT